MQSYRGFTLADRRADRSGRRSASVNVLTIVWPTVGPIVAVAYQVNVNVKQFFYGGDLKFNCD